MRDRYMSRILVVDDDESSRWVLCQTLLSADHGVLGAGDGREALALCREQPVDLVVTDLVMPGKEGIGTILELPRLQPELKIIAMSAGGHIFWTDCLPFARGLGANRTLAKPFTAQEVIEAVTNLLVAKKPGRHRSNGLAHEAEF
jgi:DNA-binding NtrC family response regulator